jgi:hypothetical protein
MFNKLVDIAKDAWKTFREDETIARVNVRVPEKMVSTDQDVLQLLAQLRTTWRANMATGAISPNTPMPVPPIPGIHRKSFNIQAGSQQSNRYGRPGNAYDWAEPEILEWLQKTYRYPVVLTRYFDYGTQQQEYRVTFKTDEHASLFILRWVGNK